MKRSPALVELSREHHTALVWAKRAKRLGDGGDGGVDRLALMAQLAAVFDRELEPHFVAEEQDLLPALQGHGYDALVARTLAEHRALRLDAERLRTGCVEAIASFAALLESHVRFEERELFAVAEAVLYSPHGD